METRISINEQQVLDGLKKAPAAVEANVEMALDRAALEVTRRVRELAPKAFSTLVNSIRSFVSGRLQRMIAPAVNYAASVEQGRPPGRQPGTQNGLQEWVRQKTGFSGKQLESVTFLIARSIGRKGTHAQPYMQPAAEQMGDRVRALISAGVERGLKEAFG